MPKKVVKRRAKKTKDLDSTIEQKVFKVKSTSLKKKQLKRIQKSENFVQRLKESKDKGKSEVFQMKSLLSSIEASRGESEKVLRQAKKKRVHRIDQGADSYQKILNLPQVREGNPFELIQQHLLLSQQSKN